MSNAQKKILLRRFTGDILPGYLPVGAFVRKEFTAPHIDLLDLSGRVVPLALQDVKMVSYVRDFNLGDTGNPERLSRRTFLARPRSEGLWVRVTFRGGGDVLEGLASADLSLFSTVIQDLGLYLTPPDTRSNTQRIFVPHTAIAEIQIVAVITTPSRKKPLPRSESTLQETLFADLPSSARPN